mgnify:FL=1
MAKKSINAFNNGEVSPSTYARYDNELYDAACLKMENFIPMQTGGAERRPGTKYLASLSSSTNVIYPFVFNNENAYSLIFTNTSLIIYKDDTIKATLSSPYLTAELYDIKLTQSADVVFIAHPNHEVRKLSRLADTNWTLEILDFKFPPLLEEDTDKTFSITGSATKGSTITITANNNQFTTDHIGSRFLIKQLRDSQNSRLAETNTTGTTQSDAEDYFVSSSINVGFSNWSIETKGVWRGRVILLRSLDGGDTYEEYFTLADTSGDQLFGNDADTDSVSNKNFTFSSTEPEPAGALLKVQYTQPDTTVTTYDGYRKFGFELSVTDPYLYGLCLITGRTSDTVATAILETPLAYTLTDYGTNWAASTTFEKGAKVTFGGTLTVTDVGATNEFIQLNDSGGSALTNVQGMTYGDAKLWVLRTANADGSGTQTVHKYTIANQGTASLAYSHDGNFDLSGTTYVRVSDIAYYNSELYVLGVNVAAPPSGANSNPLSEGGNNSLAQGSILKYNTSGAYQSTFHNFPLLNSGLVTATLYGTTFTTGLGFDGQHFYATEQQTVRNGSRNFTNPPKQVRRINRKIDTSGNQVASDDLLLSGDATFGSQGTVFGDLHTGSKNFQDWTSISGHLYALNDNTDSWDTYDTGFGNLSIAIALGQTVSNTLKGTAYDTANSKLYAVQDTGLIIEFGFVGGSVYYQATAKHASGSTGFATWLAQGYWVQRFPESQNYQEGAYSDHRGYPHSVAIYESRLCFGGTDTNPNTLWLSKTNDLNNFQTGVEANASMRLTINSNTIDEIRWLCPSSDLVIGTSSNEWTLGSGSDQLAVTPTQLNIKRKSNYGSNKLQGVLVNASVLFFMRQSTKLREWLDQNTRGVFLAADLASFAEQATEGGILQMAVQTQPETIIWMVRNDGQLIGLTYEKETKTFGWHRHTFTGATAESVTVLPTSSGEDCIYVILKKADDERCYVKMDARNWGTAYATEYFGLDNYTTASKAVSSQSASFSAEELDQFASDTVKVKVNGVLQTGTYTVGSDGSLTINSIKDASGANLANGTYTIVVGQAYTSTLAPLYAGLEFRSGSTRGSKIAVPQALIRFKDTLSAKVGQTETAADLNEVEFLSASSLNSEDVPCYLSNANEYLQTVYVVQDEPQPCTVLGMILDIEGVGK